MKLLVERYNHATDWTIGKLFIDGVLTCFTIEDEKRAAKVKGETRIPEGVYNLSTRHSPKFSPIYGHDMIWVKDVPGFEFILIHPGNTDDDTDGCLLVGDKLGIVKGQEAVLNSKNTYKKIYPKIIEGIKAGATIEYKSV